MTDDEARTVGAIACNADGGCSHCAAELIRILQKKFPSQAEVFGGAYLSAFDRSLDGEEE
jgi:hypothetical protein